MKIKMKMRNDGSEFLKMGSIVVYCGDPMAEIWLFYGGDSQELTNILFCVLYIL